MMCRYRSQHAREMHAFVFGGANAGTVLKQLAQRIWATVDPMVEAEMAPRCRSASAEGNAVADCQGAPLNDQNLMWRLCLEPLHLWWCRAGVSPRPPTARHERSPGA